MSAEVVHTLRESRGGAVLEVVAADDTPRGPMVVIFVDDDGEHSAVWATFAEVESLHSALGAWLTDRLLTGRVTPEMRRGGK